MNSGKYLYKMKKPEKKPLNTKKVIPLWFAENLQIFRPEHCKNNGEFLQQVVWYWVYFSLVKISWENEFLQKEKNKENWPNDDEVDFWGHAELKSDYKCYFNKVRE